MSDLASILQKLDQLSETTTPVDVKHGLNKQQRQVPQMPAEFKPHHISVLKNKTDPAHPAKKFFVGAESQHHDLDEAKAIYKGDFSFFQPDEDKDEWHEYLNGEPTGKTYSHAEVEQIVRKMRVTSEDVVTNVKKRLGDYLQDVANAVRHDGALQSKMHSTMDNIGPAVKTITTDDGKDIKIHGNEDDGFRITIRNRPMNSQFESLDHAVMACEMFLHRRNKQNHNQDYLDEI